MPRPSYYDGSIPRSTRLVHIAILFLLPILVLQCGEEDSPTESTGGTISGRVTGVQMALANVTARTSTSQSAGAGNDGTFLIKNVPAGTATVTISCNDHYFRELVFNVVVETDKNTDIGTIGLTDLYPDAVTDHNGYTSVSSLVGLPAVDDSAYGNGFVVIDFGDGESAVEGPGPDLQIFGARGDVQVSLSNNGSDFVAIPTDTVGSPTYTVNLGVNTDFDLAYIGLLEARYVRIENLYPDTSAIYEIKAVDHD